MIIPTRCEFFLPDLDDLIIKYIDVSSMAMILTVGVKTFNSIEEYNIAQTLISYLIVFNLAGGKFIPLYTRI